MSKINIRESLRNMDSDSCCKYDLLTMYDACLLTDEDKADIAKLLFDNEDPEVIYQKLCTYFCDDDVSELTGLTDVQNVTPFEAIINNVKMGLDQKYDSVFYNDVAGQFEIKSKDTTYTFGLSPVEYETDGISLYVDYNYDMPINYTSIKEASEDILNKCIEKVSAASQSNGYVDDDTMEYTVYDVVEDEGRLCAKCMNESTNSFEDIKLGKVNSDAVNELLNNILNNPNYKLTNDCRKKIADNSAPWGIVMSPGFDITATNALMSTGDFGGSVSFGESEELTFENGDRVTDGNRKGTVIDCDSIKVLVDWDYSETDDIEWVMKEDLSFVNSLKESENSPEVTYKQDRRLNSTSVIYKGYLIKIDRGGDGYNVYDKYRELEDTGFPSMEAAKKFVDELVTKDKDNWLDGCNIPQAYNEAVAYFESKYDNDDEYSELDTGVGSRLGWSNYIQSGIYEELDSDDGGKVHTESGYQLNRKTGDYMNESIVTNASNIGQGYTAPNMVSLVAKAKELEKWVKEYKNSKDKDAFERLLPTLEDNILDYKSEIEEKIKDFDKYWEVHKKAMLDNISEAVSILKNIGIPRLDSKLKKLDESYSDDEWIDKMWEAFQGISGIEDISEGKNPNTYVVTFDTEGSATARALILLKALIKADLDIELDSTNGSNVFTFTTPTNEWEFIKGKMIKDSDGFLTSYDWYRNTDSGLNIFMFGEDEADPDYADWETESDSEAEDWFNSYTGFDEEELDESVKSSATAEAISKELKDAAYKLFKTPKWGFESYKEIDDYINPIFAVSEDPKTGDIEVQVRAELDYDNLMELADVLNKVVEKYDSNSYFDAEQPGILCSFIREEK